MLSQLRPEVVVGQVGLARDRPEEARPDRLAGVEGDGHPSGLVRVLELGVRPLLDNEDPAETFQGSDQLSASDPRQGRHLPTVATKLGATSDLGDVPRSHSYEPRITPHLAWMSHRIGRPQPDPPVGCPPIHLRDTESQRLPSAHSVPLFSLPYRQ